MGTSMSEQMLPDNPTQEAEVLAELLRLRNASSGQIRREVARGLRYTHFRANANTNQLIQIVSTVRAATSLLEEKGLLERHALDKRTAEMAEDVGRDFASKGLGVQLEKPTTSKYEIKNGPLIDCENRIPLCKAACCKMHFALSAEDLEEGKIRWDLGQPYVIAQGDDGWCVHLDRETMGCGCYGVRPHVCRTYDCRDDSRIWLDFEKRIINPQINDACWPRKIAAAPAEQPAATPPPAISDGAPAASLGHKLLHFLPSHPEVFAWRHHFLSAFGLFLSIAFAIGSLIWLFQLGWSVSGKWSTWILLPGIVIASYAGSRALRIAESLLEKLFGRETSGSSGYMLYGGLATAIALAAWFWFGDPRGWLMIDRAVPPLLFALGIARLGCFASGCCIGSPTRHSPSISYTHPLSKAVAYYGLSGVALIPLQLYESASMFLAAIAFFLLPAEWFGTGRVLGLFLIVLSVFRTALLPFRFRLPGSQSASLVTGMTHVIFVTVGTGLIMAGQSRVRASFHEPPASPGTLAASVASAAILALLLFGVHRKPALPQTSEQGDPS
jgi:prolipoprotein diacylglyceryltransferase/Fe-S-cluster containining protein